MMNNVVLVGRLTSDPEIKEVEGKKQCSITLAVPRNYKNVEGEYETDFIPVKLWQLIAENVLEYCHKGDVMGIKGKIESNNSGIELIAEKVSFLSSSKKDTETVE